MVTARRFNRQDYAPDKLEFEIRYPANQQYQSIEEDELVKYINSLRATDTTFVGGLRYRAKDSTDRFTNIDKRDLDILYDALTDAPAHDVVECEPSEEPKVEQIETEEKEEENMNGTQRDPNDGHTVLRFCCHRMMNAMLGGSNTVVISTTNGKLQIAGGDIQYCPFCGSEIITYDPPAEPVEPEVAYDPSEDDA